MPARFQFAVLKLSEQAQTIIRRMLDRGDGPIKIASAVRKKTGERVSRFSVSRYAELYRTRQRREQRARQFTDHLVHQAQQQGCEISEMLRASFFEAFTEAQTSGSLRDMNPLLLETAHRKRRELELKEEQARRASEQKEREFQIKEQQIGLAKRRVEITEQRFQLDREKAEAILKQLEHKASSGEPLTPEDVRRFREMYGLYEEEKESEVRSEESE
jgi:hypothetical protein